METEERKKDLLRELKALEEKEAEDKLYEQKKKNFEKFMNRPSDFMIGKAHCDIDFISASYSSDREKSTMPYWVSVAWNCWHTYTGKAPITQSTHCYLHNVFTDANRKEFEKQLLKLVQKFVDKNCWNLYSVLEMMGLQSTDYWLRNYFLEEDKKKINGELENARADILNRYPDKDFLSLRNLSHSSRILFNYIQKFRPELLDKIPAIANFNK